MPRLGRRVAAGVVGGLLGLAALALPDRAGAEAVSRHAVVIVLEGAIGPASAGYVVRSLKAAERDGAAAVVLRLDTPGGLDSAMRDIIRAVLASPLPVLGFVAPSGARAASAGTYILYASALAAMAPGTNLGAATPISLFGEPPPAPARPEDKKADQKDDRKSDKKDETPSLFGSHDTLTAKVTNDAAAYIRGLASLHGRNADWAERAVREAVSLPYDAALAQHVIDVVAASEADLLRQADGRTAVVQGKPQRLATAGLALVTVEPEWRDRLLALVTDPNVVYLLLLGGLFAIAFELSHPGVIAPGVVGAICLLVGGYGLNLLPIDYAGVALALLGIGLMVAEAFVPAFGALGLGGAAAFAIGSLMMFEAPGLRPPLALIAGATIASALVFAVVVGLLMRARRRPTVTGNAVLIGARGRATRWDGGEGEVLVLGERWHARAARPLAPGQAVKVIERQGLTLVVEPAS
jgi:membrane-bound serine protease (ClpP class)